MKRKDLKVGETYYTNHRRGAKDDIFTYETFTLVPACGSKVLALEPYDSELIFKGVGKTREIEFKKVSKGNGVLVEQTYFWQGEKKTRTTIVNLSTIICPLEEAVTKITENGNRIAIFRENSKKIKERAEKYDFEVFNPAIEKLLGALGNLQQRVDGTPKHYDRYTSLGSMPLDVIETLTAIINEALVEKVGA